MSRLSLQWILKTELIQSQSVGSDFTFTLVMTSLILSGYSKEDVLKINTNVDLFIIRGKNPINHVMLQLASCETTIINFGLCLYFHNSWLSVFFLIFLSLFICVFKFLQACSYTRASIKSAPSSISFRKFLLNFSVLFFQTGLTISPHKVIDEMFISCCL